MSEPMPDPALGSQAIPTTPCDVCGITFGPGDVWNYHARLGVYVHSKCAADFPVRGEDITTHTVLWGQIPEPPPMTGPEVTQPDPDGGVEMTDGEWAAFRGVEVTAAMKAEDVDAALVEKAARAMYAADPYFHLGVPIPWDGLDQADIDELQQNARHALAAVLPEIRAQAGARLADLTARIGFGDGVTEPQADNDTIVKAVNEALTNSNTLWEVEEQVERVRALADHYEARQGTALGRVSTGNVAASIRRALGGQPTTKDAP